MPTFKSWDVIKVPFPYVEKPVRKYRPALVVAAGDLQKSHGLLWVLMITSAANKGWAEDVEITDLEQAGLPVPSVVRPAKIATIEAKEAAKLGVLPQAERDAVEKVLQSILAVT